MGSDHKHVATDVHGLGPDLAMILSRLAAIEQRLREFEGDYDNVLARLGAVEQRLAAGGEKKAEPICSCAVSPAPWPMCPVHDKPTPSGRPPSVANPKTYAVEPTPSRDCGACEDGWGRTQDHTCAIADAPSRDGGEDAARFAHAVSRAVRAGAADDSKSTDEYMAAAVALVEQRDSRIRAEERAKVEAEADENFYRLAQRIAEVDPTFRETYADEDPDADDPDFREQYDPWEGLRHIQRHIGEAAAEARAEERKDLARLLDVLAVSLNRLSYADNAVIECMTEIDKIRGSDRPGSAPAGDSIGLEVEAVTEEWHERKAREGSAPHAATNDPRSKHSREVSDGMKAYWRRKHAEQEPDLECCLRCSEGVLDSRLGGMCGDHPEACPNHEEPRPAPEPAKENP